MTDRLHSVKSELPEDYQFPTPKHAHEKVVFDIVRLEWRCKCGARFDDRDRGEEKRWFFLRGAAKDYRAASQEVQR